MEDFGDAHTCGWESKGGSCQDNLNGCIGSAPQSAGKRVHLVDMDPQANLTESFGYEDTEGVLYQALKSRGPLPVVELAENLSITPSSIDLAKAETELLAETAREYMLKTCLEKTDLPKDTLVIIDCPPSLAVLATNCFTSAEGIIVPMKAGGFELRAVGHLTEVVRVLKEYVNKQLKIVGVILTEANSRRAITQQVIEEVKQIYPVLGQIRQDVDLVEAAAGGGMLKLKRSTALEDYGVVVKKLGEELPWLKSK
ncbi:ParA family protein (plasmid) [Tundrisphaera sp. TA3]|uniref:ParA family protein n=1 Tax=Tundrisphaera sp. TA3 TaxID=3435775 RepID=UPI003EBFD49E